MRRPTVGRLDNKTYREMQRDAQRLVFQKSHRQELQVVARVRSGKGARY